MKVYQIVSFSLNDGVLCNPDIIKLFTNLENAMIYMDNMPGDKLIGRDYECSFSTDLLILYKCAFECEDDYGEPDLKYYNIIELKVFEQ